MLLKHYPRPKDDTGQGIHTSPNCHLRKELDLLPRLYQMGLRWLMMFIGNDEVTRPHADRPSDIRTIIDAGFMLLIRIAASDALTGRGKYFTNDDPPCTFPLDLLKRLVGEGAVLIRTGNEPQLANEWTDAQAALACHPQWRVELTDIVIDFELRNGALIRQAGGIPIISSMQNKGNHDHLVTYLEVFRRAKERGVFNELFERPVGLGIHPRPLNRPADYPLCLGEPYSDYPEPDQAKWQHDRAYCFLEIDMMTEIMADFGLFDVPLYADEHGYEITWGQDHRYPTVKDPAHHGAPNLALALYHQLRNWPQLMAACFWHLFRPKGIFAGEAWFENSVYGLAEMPIIPLLVQAQLPPVRDQLFAEEPEFTILDLIRFLPRRGHPPKRSPDTIDKLIIHHTATRPDISIEQVANYHVNTNGWPCIGYHLWIAPDGKISQGAALEETTYHAQEANATSVGIVLPGRFDHHDDDHPGQTIERNPPPQPQQEALAKLLRYLQGRLNLPDSAIKGDYEVKPTLCPGKEWLVKFLREYKGETPDGQIDELKKLVSELVTKVLKIEQLEERIREALG